VVQNLDFHRYIGIFSRTGSLNREVIVDIV